MTMDDSRLIRNCDLGGGITATVHDGTRHYFGGYYHVQLYIAAEVPVTADLFASDDEYADACSRLGGTVVFRRTLEKMAVPEEEITSVRTHLLENFENHLLPYLQRGTFCAGFVISEYRRSLKTTQRGYRQT